MILKLHHVLSILDDIFSPKVYDELDDFNFEIINSLVMGEDVPRSIYMQGSHKLWKSRKTWEITPKKLHALKNHGI